MLLKGSDFRATFRKFYKWLAPGGVLVVTCVSHLFYQEFDSETEYKQRLSEGCEWPGEFTKKRNNEAMNRNVPEFIHIISLDVLVREALAAGFCLLKANYYGRALTDKFYSGVSKSKQNYVSIIAIKDAFMLNLN